MYACVCVCVCVHVGAGESERVSQCARMWVFNRCVDNRHVRVCGNVLLTSSKCGPIDALDACANT